jgi:magnesium transporter
VRCLASAKPVFIVLLVEAVSGVDVRLVTGEGVQVRVVDELDQPSIDAIKEVQARPDGMVWVDIPTTDAEAIRALAEVFGFHPLAVQDCLKRNPVPKVHVYPGHVFVVLHAPEPGEGGHVHYVELDQFVSPGLLVTVHGPLNPAVDPQAALVETSAVARRLDSGRLQPTIAFDLSFAVVTALAGRMRDFVAAATNEVWRLEQQVTGGHKIDTEEFLDEMFRVRHGLLAVRTMARLSREVYGRMAGLKAFGSQGRLLKDLTDQFRGISMIADGQHDYLQGVIEFFQTRAHTKMTIAAERLAVIAAVTLPITAISSVMGMNVIVNTESDPVFAAILIAIMVIISVLLLIWTRRQGWW